MGDEGTISGKDLAKTAITNLLSNVLERSDKRKAITEGLLKEIFPSLSTALGSEGIQFNFEKTVALIDKNSDDNSAVPYVLFLLDVITEHVDRLKSINKMKIERTKQRNLELWEIGMIKKTRLLAIAMAWMIFLNSAKENALEFNSILAVVSKNTIFNENNLISDKELEFFISKMNDIDDKRKKGGK